MVLQNSGYRLWRKLTCSPLTSWPLWFWSILRLQVCSRNILKVIGPPILIVYVYCSHRSKLLIIFFCQKKKKKKKKKGLNLLELLFHPTKCPIGRHVRVPSYWEYVGHRYPMLVRQQVNGAQHTVDLFCPTHESLNKMIFLIPWSGSSSRSSIKSHRALPIWLAPRPIWCPPPPV